MPDVINQFRGQYSFLSNFHPCKVVFEGVEYSSSEHAYMAAKTTHPDGREWIRSQPTAAQAKAEGRNLVLRDGWEGMKYAIMVQILMAKFSEPVLKDKLLATGDYELIEGNWWGDKVWGVCLKSNQGQNLLGKALMEVRKYYHDQCAYNLIVAGGRDFNDYELLSKVLTVVATAYLTDEQVSIVSGGARGADALGERFAKEQGVNLITKPADWKTYGNSAGYRRNEEMALISNGLLAFWDGKSKGTKHMIDAAQRRGLDVFIQMYGQFDQFFVPDRFA